GRLLGTLLRPESGLTARPAPHHLALVQELATLAGTRQDVPEVGAVLRAVLALNGSGALPVQMAALGGLADGMGRRGPQLGSFLSRLGPGYRETTAQAEAFLGRTAALAADSKADRSERLAAVRLLAHAAWPMARPVLTKLFTEEPE